MYILGCILSGVHSRGVHYKIYIVRGVLSRDVQCLMYILGLTIVNGVHSRDVLHTCSVHPSRG